MPETIKTVEIVISADGSILRIKTEKGILLRLENIERIVIYDRRES